MAFWNDTTTNLAISAVYTGGTRDLGNSVHTYFNATAYSSHASAAVGFAIESSNDNSTWLVEAQSALTAVTPVTLSVPITTRYYRVKLTNGTTATTTLRVNSGTSVS